MRICRFNENQLGVVLDSEVVDVTEVLDALPSYTYPLPSYDILAANFKDIMPRIEQAVKSGKRFPIADVKLLSPIANPGKIVAAPVNYSAHLAEARADPNLNHQAQVHEIQRVGLFLKATSSLIGAGDPVQIRMPERRTDHEVELAVIIGKEASKINRRDALDYVLGYSIGLDITVRGPEDRSLRKSSDTYTVLGPWLATADEVSDTGNLELSLTVNDEVRQRSNTSDLILGVAELIEFASSYYTLYPGDVLITGTPAGVGPIHSGDVMNASIASIGSMSVVVA